MKPRSEALLAALLIGCGGKVLVDPGDGSETHFVCAVDQDCTQFGSRYRCVAMQCQAVVVDDQAPLRVSDASIDVHAAAAVEPPPLPEGAIAGATFPSAIAVDAASVYFLTGTGSTTYADDAVMKVPKGGGTPTTLAPARRPLGIAVDATHVYWTNYPSFAGIKNDLSQNTVMKVPIDGGEPVTLASDQRAPVGIAVDATSVYWTNYVDLGTVMSVPKDGGTPTVLALGQNYPGPIAVDATNVYWTAEGYPSGAGFKLMKIPIAGGTPVRLALAQTGASGGIAVDGTSVYATLGPSNWNPLWNVPDGGAAIKVPIGGGESVTLASDQSNAGAVAVDAAGVYWVNAGSYSDIGAGYLSSYNHDGAVMMLPTGDEAPVMLASTWTCPGGFAVDTTSVYWTVGSLNGAVMRTAKPGVSLPDQ